MQVHDLVSGASGGKLHFYHAEKISDNQYLTPEKYLVCTAVPIARTGTMTYHKSEVPIDVSDSDMVIIERNEDEVFAVDTIASFMGKPVTNDHPRNGVDASNWRSHAIGTVQNVRRGEGEFLDHLVADLLITDRKAIADVRSGKREVSCGYDAIYTQVSPGRGKQQNIIGNHVALVSRGRCGATCSIKDKDFSMEINEIKDAVKSVFADMFGQKQTHDCGGNDDRIGKMADQLSKLAETTVSMQERFTAEDAARKATKDAEEQAAKDMAAKEEADKEEKMKKEKEKSKDSYSDILAKAEIMAPGIRLEKPAADMTVAQASSLKRTALDAAIKTDTGVKHIVPLLAGRTVDALSEETLDLVFISSSALVKNINNTRVSQDRAAVVDVYQKGGLQSVADSFWKQNK